MARSNAVATASGYDRLFRRIQTQVREKIPLPVEIAVRGASTYHLGEGEPAVKVFVNDPAALSTLRRLDEWRMCDAYVNGSLDISGDMLGVVSLRRALRDHQLLHSLWRRVTPWFLGRIPTDQLSNETHHDFPIEFYIRFLGSTRSYSQALFDHDDEPLETAQLRKLNFAIDACHLKPGDNVLDVGDDWGSFAEHAGQRGIRVTSLTRTGASDAFVAQLIHQRQLPCRVLNQDIMQHTTTAPYDAIVIPRAMDCLPPDYMAALRQIRGLLKPGGLVYLDASAFAKRDAKPTFIARQVFRASLAHLCQQEFLAAAVRNQLEVMAVHNDRHSCFLTCKAWAENLEAAEDEISHRWGQALFRVFQLYLWSLAHAFLSRGMEAYRMVLRRPQATLAIRHRENGRLLQRSLRAWESGK